MKKYLIIMLIAITPMAFAQENPDYHKGKHSKLTKEERVQKHVDKLSEKLDLNEDQKKKIYEIELETANKREKHRAEMIKLKKEMKADREAALEKIKKELSEEQKQKLEELHQERIQRHRDCKKDHSEHRKAPKTEGNPKK